MTPRARRLVSDLRSMESLAEMGTIAMQGEGAPPDRYRVMFNVAGLHLVDSKATVRETHRCEIYLHRDYPRRPPVVTWESPVFHPNLLGPERNGGVCLGSWSASESLGDLCLRLRDLVSYRSFNCADALNNDAAEWVTRERISPGLDLRSVEGRLTQAASSQVEIGGMA